MKKICSNCKQEKAIDQFSKGGIIGTYRSICKVCAKAYQQAWAHKTGRKREKK